MPDREQRVREIAHRLWEEEGRPHDQEKRHWHAAERMVDAEATAKPTAAGKRRTERKAAKRTPASPHASVTQTH